MKCPVCASHTLVYDSLQEGLCVQRCHACGGLWISSNDFLDWRRAQSQVLPIDEDADDRQIVIADSNKAKLCLDCGHILTRHAVLPDGRFKVDHCGHCNGIWLDGNEWQALRLHGLHTRLNELFTAVWQMHLRRERQRDWFERLYATRFGADYDKLKAMRTWIHAQPNAGSILAYLSARDPYAT